MNFTFCWHQWSKWDIKDEGPALERDINDPKHENRVVGWTMLQTRRCDCCGLRQIKKSRTR